MRKIEVITLAETALPSAKLLTLGRPQTCLRSAILKSVKTMKRTRLFMMAALALTLVACSKDDDGLTPQPAEQQPTEQTAGQEKVMHFTATISIGGVTDPTPSPSP